MTLFLIARFIYEAHFRFPHFNIVRARINKIIGRICICRCGTVSEIPEILRPFQIDGIVVEDSMQWSTTYCICC